MRGLKKAARLLSGAALVAGFVLPAAPAVADDNPCKGDGTTSKCRPPCELRIEPGDPAAGIGPSIDYYC
ncbi:MAG TPA: hypothetical protein VFS18_03225 [Actinomycetota bacterium]|nr:hypothetical protein [Actinomycetota bacterium]